jgi:hypothetical protein
METTNLNIFFLSRNPILAAQYQCDKHVVKMVLESAQILSTNYRLEFPDVEVPLYKSTHVNHPCVKWVREKDSNYSWLVKHAKALSDEYTYRYGKVHKSNSIIELCRTYKPTTSLNKLEITDPPLAMQDEYKCDDPVLAYRNYYFFGKGSTIKCEWTKRSKPWWWKELEKNEATIYQ